MKFEEAIAKLRDKGRPGDALVDSNGERLFYVDGDVGICTEYELYPYTTVGKSSLLDKIVKEDVYYVPAKPEYTNLQTAIRECIVDDIICNADSSRVCASLTSWGWVFFHNGNGSVASIDPDILFNDRWYVE